MKYWLMLVSGALLLVGCGDGQTSEGERLYKSGQFQEALEYYNAYLESNPKDIKTLYNRGRVLEELKKYKLAESDFLLVIDKDERNLNARLSLSKVYYAQELYNKAVLIAEQAIELNENSSDAHFLAGRAKHQLGYVDGALESYTLAIKINPNYGEAYLYRGAIKVHKKKNRAACEDFRKAENLEIKEAISIRKKYCS